MDELLAALLGAVFEILCEALIEILLEVFVAFLSRTIRKLFVVSRRVGRLLTTVVFAVTGCTAGFLSLAVFPHPLVHPSRFHGVSLLISPAVAGLAMALIGRIVRSRGGKSVQIESFGYGFIFALAMALVRFVLVK
jgi:hypothetical protein